mgnify:CR=1 FL=1
MEDSEKQQIKKHFDNIYQIHLSKMGHVEVFHGDEDLPSDKFGADFSVNYFDSNSELSFGEQLQNYLNNVLGATNPKNAPNYENLPTEYPVKGELPSVQNRTTQPMFIKE